MLFDLYGEGQTVAEAIVNNVERMCKLLQRCVERNIFLNSSETKFILKQGHLQYIGHIFWAIGLYADPEKVRPIIDNPTQDGAAAMLWFLGMVNYVAKFVPALSDLCHPLRETIKMTSGIERRLYSGRYYNQESNS